MLGKSKNLEFNQKLERISNNLFKTIKLEYSERIEHLESFKNTIKSEFKDYSVDSETYEYFDDKINDIIKKLANNSKYFNLIEDLKDLNCYIKMDFSEFDK
jgi:uncharacterized protein (UPF0335 family)